jgi:hypothetical protein
MRFIMAFRRPAQDVIREEEEVAVDTMLTDGAVFCKMDFAAPGGGVSGDFSALSGLEPAGRSSRSRRGLF